MDLTFARGLLVAFLLAAAAGAFFAVRPFRGPRWAAGAAILVAALLAALFLAVHLLVLVPLSTP
jgi:hypothetical protein